MNKDKKGERAQLRALSFDELSERVGKFQREMVPVLEELALKLSIAEHKEGEKPYFALRPSELLSSVDNNLKHSGINHDTSQKRVTKQGVERTPDFLDTIPFMYDIKTWLLIEDMISLADNKRQWTYKGNETDTLFAILEQTPKPNLVREVLKILPEQLEVFAGRNDISDTKKKAATEAKIIIDDEIMPKFGLIEEFLNANSAYRARVIPKQVAAEETRAKAASAKAIEEARARRSGAKERE